MTPVMIALFGKLRTTILVLSLLVSVVYVTWQEIKDRSQHKE